MKRILHLALSGDSEDLNVRHVASILSTCNKQNIAISYFPHMPSKAKAYHQSQAEIIRSHLIKGKERNILGTYKIKNHRSFDNPSTALHNMHVTEFEIQRVMESLAPIVGEANLKSDLFANLENVSVVPDFAALEKAIESFGPLSGAFILDSFQDLFSDDGDVFLSDLFNYFTNTSSPEFVCFKGPFHELPGRSIAFEKSSTIHFCFLNPLLIFQQDIVLTLNSLNTKTFEEMCSNLLKTFGAFIYSSTNYSLKLKERGEFEHVFNKLFYENKSFDRVQKVLALILAVKAAAIVDFSDFSSEVRLNGQKYRSKLIHNCLSQVSIYLNEREIFVFEDKFKEYMEERFGVKTVAMLNSALDDRYTLEKFEYLNYWTVLFEDTFFLVDYPLKLLKDPRRERLERAVENYIDRNC